MGVSPLAQRRCIVKGWDIKQKHGWFVVTRIRDNKELARSKSEHTALELAKIADKKAE